MPAQNTLRTPPAHNDALPQDEAQNPAYHFTNNWFEIARPVWQTLIPMANPATILEIGAYEGAATCFLIDMLAPQKSLEIHAIDSFDGGLEHQAANTDMSAVEARFRHNAALAISNAANPVDLRIHKGFSDRELAKLLALGKQDYFDFIYVDGSHQAPDVLCDAVLAFRLLKIGGILAFDDYLWAEPLATGVDPLRCPKPAIDAFTNIYCRKLRILTAPLYQLYVQKLSD